MSTADPFCRGHRCGHHQSVHDDGAGRCRGLFNAYDPDTGDKYTVDCRCAAFTAERSS